MKGAYKAAGVDIDAGELFTRMIAAEVAKAWPEVKIGGFADGGIIPPRAVNFKAGVDGVGTKIDLARRMGTHRETGIDAVAMATVDLYMNGTLPAAFYDYLMVDHLDPELHIQIIRGMIEGCQEAGCFLGGGETAEHPNVGLPKGFYDIAGFCLGFPDPALQLDPKANIRPGMALWGWRSYGLGSNGYSLARKVFKLRNDRPSRIKELLERYHNGVGMLADALLRPTEIHIKNIEAVRQVGVKFVGHAHITGGGLVGNIPRILPDNCVARLRPYRWVEPPIFELIRSKGNIDEQEMRRVFNLGLQVVSVTDRDSIVPHMECCHIGYIRHRKGDEPQVEFAVE